MIADSLLDELPAAPRLADGGMGSYLFARTGRIFEAGHFYVALSLDHPETTGDMHLDFLQTGARCVTTNTSADHRSQLHAVGDEDRWRRSTPPPRGSRAVYLMSPASHAPVLEILQAQAT